MRILVEVWTNRGIGIYTFDFSRRWPFFAFENLTKKSLAEK